MGDRSAQMLLEIKNAHTFVHLDGMGQPSGKSASSFARSFGRSLINFFFRAHLRSNMHPLHTYLAF